MSAAFKWGNFYYDTHGKTWHGDEDKNNPITTGMNTVEASRATGLADIQVVFADDISRIETPNGVIEVPAEKRSLWLVNTPWTPNSVQDLNRKIEWYVPIQNIDYAETLLPLCKTYQVSSVFHCGTMGETIVFQFEMPEFYVAGLETERHQSFLTIAENRHTGKKFFGVTSVRIVCQNTFNMAINKGLRSLPNSKSPELMLAFQVALEEHRISQVVALNDLFKKPATKEDVTAVANALFPMPKVGTVVDRVKNATDMGYNMSVPTAANNYLNEREKLAQDNYRRAMARQADHLNEFFMRYDRFNDEFPYAANTAYSLWNAATEHINHTQLYRSDSSTLAYNLYFQGDQGKSLERAWIQVNK